MRSVALNFQQTGFFNLSDQTSEGDRDAQSPSETEDGRPLIDELKYYDAA